MDKVHIYIPVQNNDGDVIENVIVRFLQPGTTTLITDDVYASPTDPDSIIGQPFSVTNGIVDVYITDPQRLRVGVTVPGQAEFFIEDVDVLPSGANVVVVPDNLAVTNLPTQPGMILQSINSNTAEWGLIEDVGGTAAAAEAAAKAYTDAATAPLAPTASPELTGTPTAPTATAGTNTTQLATTAFVDAAVAAQAAADSGTYAPITPDLYDTFATDSDGSIADAPSGQAYTVGSSGGEGAGGVAVVDGFLTARPPVDPATRNSVYLMADLGGSMRWSRLRFTLDLNDHGPALISTADNTNVIGSPWLHLEAHILGWTLTYITDPGGVVTLNPIASGVFTTPLPYGTDAIYDLGMFWDPDTESLTVLLPAQFSAFTLGPTATGSAVGNLAVVSDPNIAENLGRYMIVEPATIPAGTATRIKSTSGDAL